MPEKNGKLLLGRCNLKDRKLSTTDFGSTITHPVYTFSDTEKNIITIIDSNEFKDFSFKAGTIEKTINTISLHEITANHSTSFVPYYDMKTMLVYFLFGNEGSYAIYRHRKKKLVSHVNGSIEPIGGVLGILGFFKKEVGDIMQVYNREGVYSFIAKRFIPNAEKSATINQPKEARDVKEEIKDKHKFKPNQDKSYVKKGAIPEDELTVKEFIRTEIDGAIKTTVLPVIETHMKRFEEQFEGLVTKEIAQLRQTVKEETAKMQGTGAVFEGFMKRMLDMSAKFTGNLENQMKEMSLSSMPQVYHPKATPYNSYSAPSEFAPEYKPSADYAWNTKGYNS